MEIIGTADNGQRIVLVSVDELCRIVGCDYPNDVRRALGNDAAEFKPGLKVDVSKIYRSTKAIRNLRGSIDYQIKSMTTAFNAAMHAAEEISNAVTPPEDRENGDQHR